MFRDRPRGRHDKSVPQAAYAAIAYGVISVESGLFALVQYFVDHRPGSGRLISHDFVSQQYLRHTPLITAVSIVIAAIFGVLAFFIFRRSRVAVVLMLAFVVLLQLYTWFIAHSAAGTLVRSEP